MSDKIRDLIMHRANAAEIKAAAISGGMTTMLDDALAKAAKGLTSLEEILRVVHE